MLNRTRGYVANYRTPPAITVSFDAETYTATEGGTAATVRVRLSEAPGRAIDIPFTATSTTGATASDYTVPRSVAFAANDTEKTFTVTAVDDAVDDDAESVTLTLGALLPGGVSAGSPATATVTLTDNDTVTGAPSILSVSLTSDPGGGYGDGRGDRSHGALQQDGYGDGHAATRAHGGEQHAAGIVCKWGAARSRDVFLRGGRRRDRCGWGEYCRRQPGRSTAARSGTAPTRMRA